MGNKYKKLAKNSFWTLLGNAGSKLLGFLLLPLYTRWLGTAGFGESDLITTYSSLLICVMTVCVADSIFVFTKNEADENKKVYFSSTLLFSFAALGIWMLIWFVLDVIFEYCKFQNSFSNNMWLIYAVVVTTFLQQYSQQFILSLEKIKIYSFTGIVYTISLLAFSCFFIPIQSVKGYIWAIIYANVVTTAYGFFISRSYKFVDLNKIEGEKVIAVLKYSIPLIPNSIMWWLVSALNRPVMEYNLSYSDIGIFAVANRFPAIITMVFTVFSAAWSISVFEEYGKKDYDAFYKNAFRLLFVSITIIASFVVVFSDQIIRLFAAPEFAEAWKYMIILIIGAVYSCMSGFFGTNFGVVKQSKYLFYSSIWGAVTAITFNFLLIPNWGVWGTSFSVLLSFLAMMVSRYVYSMKYVNANLMPFIIKYTLVFVIVSIFTFIVDSWVIKSLLFLVVISLLLLGEKDIVKQLYLKFFPNKDATC